MTTLLLAQGLGDILATLFPLIVAAIYVISQLMARKTEQQRRADQANRRAQQQQQPKRQNRPQPAQRPASSGDDEVDDFLRRVAELRQGQPQQPVEVATPPPPRRDLGQSVEDEVRRMQAEVRHLGREADDDIDEHVHEVFDHEIGQLAMPRGSQRVRGNTAAILPSDNAAEAVVALLKSPQGITQGFLLSEILKRPDFK